MRIDHVLLGVSDLDRAAERLLEQTGLAASGGGEHPGLGTANRIVPLGDEYIELIAVVDPTSDSPLASMLTTWVAEADTLIGLSIEVDDIDAVGARLGSAVIPMERATSDGPPIRFRVTGMELALGQQLPFFIQWVDGRERRLGSRPAPHRGVEPTGIAWVDLGGDPAQVREHLGGDLPGVRLAGGDPGVHAAGIALADGREIVVR